MESGSGGVAFNQGLDREEDFRVYREELANIFSNISMIKNYH
jgi:hypothetical protein